jgi:hypothetical protein
MTVTETVHKINGKPLTTGKNKAVSGKSARFVA